MPETPSHQHQKAGASGDLFHLQGITQQTKAQKYRSHSEGHDVGEHTQWMQLQRRQLNRPESHDLPPISRWRWEEGSKEKEVDSREAPS